MLRWSLLPFLLLLAVGTVVLADASRPAPLPGPFRRIRVVDFEGAIDGVLEAYLRRQLDAAREAGTDCLVLRIDSPGGTVRNALAIGDLLLGVPESTHVVAWVPEMAYSAAAMAALACDEIVMGQKAHLGDAQPITYGADGKPEPLGEKIESPLRAKFRDYAERNGYPVVLAESMVSADVEVLRVRDATGRTYYVRGQDYRDAAPEAELVPGVQRAELVQVGGPVVAAGQLLTMTAREALDLGFLQRRFGGEPFPASEAALLADLEAPGAVVEQVAMSFGERASRALLQIAGVLAAIVAVAVLVFMWQGPGLMTIIGGTALILLVLINATADQINGFPLFLIGLGVLLLAAEVFVIPGFGIAGVLGFLTLGAGFLLLAGGATLGDTALESDQVYAFGFQFILTAIAGMVLLLVLSRWVPALGPARRMVLAAPTGTAVGAPGISPPPAAVGQRGRARSALRPAGTVEIAGHLVDVVTEGGFVAAGETVVVVAVEGSRVAVRPVEGDAPEDLA